MRVCLTLGVVLLLAVRLLPVATRHADLEVAAGRGDICCSPGAAHEIMGEAQQGKSMRPWESAGSAIEYAPTALRKTLCCFGVTSVFRLTEGAGSMFAKTLGESWKSVGSYQGTASKR
jgi:hypothetical protein